MTKQNGRLHSPRAARPVTCPSDRRQTYHVSFQRRATRTARTTATQRHAAVLVCQSCCIDVEQEARLTSRADVVTSVIACRRGICPFLSESTATSRTSDHRMILARYSTESRRRTVDDHRGRRRCPMDVSVLSLIHI